jgi:hypothetical protein
MPIGSIPGTPIVLFSLSQSLSPGVDIRARGKRVDICLFSGWEDAGFDFSIFIFSLLMSCT